LDPDPEAALAVVQAREAMDALIDRLPTEFREVLVLRELEELSYREIAEVVQVPVGTVMSRLSRARRLVVCWARESRMAEASHGV
jgi:RNA polymerase sigma-70 factor (ECF subfamily)